MQQQGTGARQEMTARPRIDLVFPCFDPPAEWAERLAAKCNLLQQELPEVELTYIIVDDGCSIPLEQKDRDLLDKGPVRAVWLSHSNNMGKGSAVRTGVEASDAGLCLFTDIDTPYSTESMVRACRALLEGANVVLGHRREAYYEQVPMGRRMISRTFRWLLHNLLKLSITDTQCGLKGFDAKGREIFLRTRTARYLFDMEFVIMVTRVRALRIAVIDAELDEGVQFKRMGTRVLVAELVNLIKVLRKREPKS
jgi:glycosyltransferase involved in cell wall biosynthesis